MCAIVDSNVAQRFNKKSPCAVKFSEWLLDHGGSIVIGGGTLADEYLNCPRLLSIIRELGRASKVRVFSDKEVASAEAKLKTLAPKPKSNDLHILALAQISNARILYSNDKLLHADFKNTKILAGTKGKVYQDPKHFREVLINGPKCI